MPGGATEAGRPVVGGNVPRAPRSCRGGRRGSAVGSVFVQSRKPGAPAPPDSRSSPIHSSPPSEGSAEEGRGRSPSQSCGILVVRPCGDGSRPSLCGAAGPASGRWSWPPGAWAVPGAPRPGPIVPPLATRSCLWPGAGGGPAPGAAVTSSGRSDRVLRAPTRWGPPGRWHLWSGGAGHCDPHGRPGPSRQPSAKCFPSANKGRTPAPSPPAPTSERERGRVVSQSEWVFCAPTFGPRSLHPTSFPSPFDVGQMSSSLAGVPELEEVSCSWAGPETSIVSSVLSPPGKPGPFWPVLGSIWGRDTGCLDWKPFPSPCLAWWQGL